MIKRLSLAAGFAVTLLAFAPAAGHAQEARRITAEWQNAPLSHVIRGLAAFAGRTIVIAPEVGDAQVTAAFQNVDWQRALAAILFQLGLVDRVDTAGVIRIERAR